MLPGSLQAPRKELRLGEAPERGTEAAARAGAEKPLLSPGGGCSPAAGQGLGQPARGKNDPLLGRGFSRRWVAAPACPGAMACSPWLAATLERELTLCSGDSARPTAAGAAGATRRSQACLLSQAEAVPRALRSHTRPSLGTQTRALTVASLFSPGKPLLPVFLVVLVPTDVPGKKLMALSC